MRVRRKTNGVITSAAASITQISTRLMTSGTGIGTTIELWARDRWHAAQHVEGEELERWTLAIAEKLDL